MGTKARKIQNEVLQNLPSNKRLFAINAGMGWQGKVIRHDGNLLVLSNPRPLHAAPAGWPDLAGWETIKITPEMVGQEIAVFVAEEIKAGDDKLSEEQSDFGKLLEKMGGIFRVISDK
jgi:hypothetical protein